MSNGSWLRSVAVVSCVLLAALFGSDVTRAQVAGQWETTEGPMTLREVGGSVQGSYGSDNGRISGTLEGGVLEGHWAEDTSARRCGKPGFDGRHFWGRARFTFQGDHFTGTWGYCEDEPGAGSWSGARAGTRLPPPTPAPPPTKAAYWRYLRTESGTVPYDPKGCYQPRVHTAQDGLVEVTITACGQPIPAQSRFRLEWNAPPKVIHPGKAFDFQLKTTLTANLAPSWTLSGGLGFGVAGFLAPPTYTGSGPSVGPAGNPHHGGESWSWDNLQRPPAERTSGPPEWWATDPREAAAGRKMRVNAVVSASETLWWSYVYELVEGATPEPPPETAPILVPDTADLGSLWRTREANPQGQGCDGVWRRRLGTQIFDAHWQCVGGPVVDVLRIERLAGDEVVVYRAGTTGRYTLTLSPDRRRIITGRIEWAPDWSFTGTIE